AAVLLLALGAQLRVGRRGRALGDRQLALRRDAVREVRWIRHHDLTRGLPGLPGGLLAGSGGEPVIEHRLRDRGVADLRDRTRGNVVAAARDGGRKDGRRGEHGQNAYAYAHEAGDGSGRAHQRSAAAWGSEATSRILSEAATTAAKRSAGSSGIRSTTVLRPDS